MADELRYTHRGNVAHTVTSNIFDRDILTATCGLSAHSYWWLGTGSQKEYDRAESLPICRNCIRRAP